MWLLRRTAEQERRRLVGIDMARCLALVGMMATHILPGLEGLEVPWPQQLAGGRAAALFAVLAGVSMSLVSGRQQPVTGLERRAVSGGLAVRALLIAILGLALAALPTNVAIILTYYGVLFLLGLPFLGLDARTLAGMAAIWVVAAPVFSHAIRAGLPEREAGSPTVDRLLHPVQLLSDLTFTGTYPAFPWLAYLLAGMAIGRIDLSSARNAWRLLGTGTGLALIAWSTSHLLTSIDSVDTTLRTTFATGVELSGAELDALLTHGLFGVTPTDSWWWLAVVAPHTSTPFDLVQTIGSAMAVIGLCLLVSRLNARVMAVAFGAGAMTLTLYSLHVVLLTPAFWPPEEAHTYAKHVVVVLTIGAVFALLRLRGPLETAVGECAAWVADAVRYGVRSPGTGWPDDEDDP